MSSLDHNAESKQHWRSLAELADAPEFRAFLEAEFPAKADPRGISRRRWMQLMGASIALASLSGCRIKQEEILPFAQRPANRVPGEPQYYATAMELSGSATGLLVTSRDGRPVKIEGNPQHSQSQGATDSLAQAAVLGLYDPDRSRMIRQMTKQGAVVQPWEKFAEVVEADLDKLRTNKGAGLRVLAETTSSPTLATLRARLLQSYPEAQWHEYEPLSRDNERAGAKQAFGKPYRTLYDFEQADVIVCLDADLLSDHPAALQHARAFAKRREPTDGRMNRLYAVESGYSMTGSMADHRLRLRSGQIAAFTATLEQQIAGTDVSKTPGLAQSLATGGVPAERLQRALQAIAKDLTAHRGRAIVAAGPAQPPEVHAAVHRINAALENAGKTVRYMADPEPDRPSHVEAIRALTADMRSGKVDTLVILGGNPVYNAPADLEFGKALQKVSTRIHLSPYFDETSRECTWHVPQAHFLEAWGDARSYDGTYSIVQPLIEPLWGGKSAIELVALVVGEKASAYDLVRQTFKETIGNQGFEEKWRRTLHDGLLADSRWREESPKLAAGSGEAPKSREAESGDSSPHPGPLPEGEGDREDLEIVFGCNPLLYDGRFANNGWLQETPAPMTRLAWDNAAIFSPATAKTLGVENQTLVRLKYAGREIEIPAYVLPGQADGSVTVPVGYGRLAAGSVGGSVEANVPSVGVDTYRLRQSKAMGFDRGLSVQPTGKPYTLASTQDHHAIDTIGQKGRAERLGQLVREATLAEYKADPQFAQHTVHHPPLASLFDEPKYEGHRWGMSIDLNKCLGCSACMVACQAENNVPIVGKSRLLEGREMHWIRVDRYFRGSPDDPAVSHQVVTCQHCENAPCEQVCPVMATVHSAEGLNEMVYNRCVGTRYCSNNCPYKVRRFNFFNYHKDLGKPDNAVLKMVYNPEVTVRSRGVMEKCTYCVQRIQAARVAAKNEGREIRDGQIQTACQQACPTQAITFGDLNDPASQVLQDHTANRAYDLLGELNTKPRTAYLARIRNPNPELEDGHHDHHGHAG
jgi:molybdopterin-containing oxidoreductase family iron-sulfur binding subunit